MEFKRIKSFKQYFQSVRFGLVSKEDIMVDLKKIKTVKDWFRPASVTEIQSFLGLAGYYRRFVEGFSSIASP